MKKRIWILAVTAFVLIVAVAATLILVFGRGLKTVDNEYLYTLEGEWEGTKDFSEGLAAVKQDGKWGYIDTNGDLVIEPTFDGANPFSEGLAAVQRGNKWGYIDTRGNTVISFTLDSTYAFSEGLAVYASGYYYGYIDTTGAKVTEALYEEASSFHNGIACVRKGSRYGFIDKTGTPITEFLYGAKSEQNDGLIPVFYGDSQQGINTGYLDENGTLALDFLWYDARSFCDGLAAACVEYTKPYGFIDKSGAFVIQPTWDRVEDFSEGRALVEKNRAYTYIDTSGTPITEKTYEKAYSFTASGLARVATPAAGGWNFGFINTSGEEVIPPSYTVAMDFAYGCAAVSNGTAWGFIDETGVQMCGYLWDDVGDFTEDGIARVRTGDSYGFVKLK